MNITAFYFNNAFLILGSEPVKTAQYTPYGVVTEFRYSDKLSYILRKTYPMRTLANWGPKQGFIPNSRDALVFVNNHDTERGHGAGGQNIVTYKDRKLYIMGNAFMLAHPYGTPRFLSNFDFLDRDSGKLVRKSSLESKKLTKAQFLRPTSRCRLQHPLSQPQRNHLQQRVVV